MDKIEWFFIILMADLVASGTVALLERIDYSRIFKRKKKRMTSRRRKVAPVIPIRNVE